LLALAGLDEIDAVALISDVKTLKMEMEANALGDQAGAAYNSKAMLRKQPPQISHPGGRERDGLLVVGAIDPEAAVFRLHVGSQVPQELLVAAEDFGGTAGRAARSGT
jgi:hypothetical protein